MKKIIILLSSTILLSSCIFSELAVIKDEFKNTKSAYINIAAMPPSEEFSQFNAKQKIIKEINPDGTSNASIFFTIIAQTDSFGIDNDYFIKINSKTYEYSIDKINKSAKSSTTSSSRRVYKPNTDISPGHTSGHWDTETDVESHAWTEYSFSIILEPELIPDILSSDQFIIRFYSAKSPVTLVYEEEYLKAIKSVLIYK